MGDTLCHNVTALCSDAGRLSSRDMEPPSRNDPCPCNSGKKYKKCCLLLDETRQMRTDQARAARSLHEKNIALLEGMYEIFDLKRPWQQVKEGMSDARIREFYEHVAVLWPSDTDPNLALPSPDSSLRALYLGENEPELVVENIYRFCLYADQIIVVYPFQNPNLIAEKYNPIPHPDEWRIQTLRVVFYLMLLAPWVYAGLVELIPDPGDFDRNLRVKTWDLAAERLKGWRVSKEDVDNSLIRVKAQRTFLMSPRDYLERKYRELKPDVSDEEVRKLLDYVERERASDPLLPNQTLDQMAGQMMSTNMGANLEMGLFICHATGAFPYTNVKFRWKEILNAQSLNETAQLWSPLTMAFQQLRFKFLEKVDSEFACSVRKDGRLEGFRSYLRKLWHELEGGQESEEKVREFRDELSQAYQEAQAEWNAIDRELLKFAVPKLGATLAGGLFSPAFAVGGFTAVGISELIQSHMKRREFRERTPMSVFIDLDRK